MPSWRIVGPLHSADSALQINCDPNEFLMQLYVVFLSFDLYELHCARAVPARQVFMLASNGARGGQLSRQTSSATVVLYISRARES